MPKKFPTFDECYSATPKVKRPEHFIKFWEEEIIKIKKKPLEPVSKLILRKSLKKGILYDIQYRGHQENIIEGYLNLPRKLKKVPLVITIHDYWEEFHNIDQINDILIENGIAHLHIYLHKREFYNQQNLKHNEKEEKSEYKFPPVFLETFKQPFRYDYGVFLILDVLRSIDFIRLNKHIRHDKLGIYGRGLGANLAIFAAAFRPESVRVLSLERISPVWFEYYIKYSHSQLAKEYQKIIQHKKSKKDEPAPYQFMNDPIFIADDIKIPILMSVGLEDEKHPAYCAFGLFNLLRCDKNIQIFTDEKQDPMHMKELEASLNFIIQHLNED